MAEVEAQPKSASGGRAPMDKVEAEKKAALAAGMSYMPMDQPEDESVEEEAAPPRPLSRDQILGADDNPAQMVEVPGWGCVCFRLLSVEERTEVLQSWRELSDPPALGEQARVHLQLVVRCVCDPAGHRLLMDSDIPALQRKSAQTIDALVGYILQANGLTDDAVEEAEKNSDSSPSDDSSSSSPSASAAPSENSAGG